MTISDASHLFSVVLLLAAFVAAAVAWSTDTGRLDPLGPDSIARLVALNQAVESPTPRPYDWAAEMPEGSHG